MTDSGSDYNQAQTIEEDKKPECNSTSDEAKTSDALEEFQAAYRRKFAETYKRKEIAEEAAKKYQEWSDEYEYDFDSWFQHWNI